MVTPVPRRRSTWFDPRIVRPSSTLAFGHALATSAKKFHAPPPPCVQKGASVFPASLFASRKVATGGAGDDVPYTVDVRLGARLSEPRALLLVQVEGAVGHPAYQMVASVRLKVPWASHGKQFTKNSVTPTLLRPPKTPTGALAPLPQ